MARNWSSGDIVTATNLGSIERGVNAVSSMYEPTTWENGDVFTAEKLNNIEQGIENASNLWTTLIEESVTTEQNRGSEASGIISISLTEELIRVTFNGVEYICNAYAPQDAPSGIMAYGSSYADGEPTFDDYPFWILSNGMIMTQTAGTYTIKIEAPQSGGSSDFSTAEVTLINTSGFVFYEHNCFAGFESGAIGEDSPAATANFVHVISGAPQTIKVPLYQGMAMWMGFADGRSISITGDASYDDGILFITGNCTITISDSSSEPVVK